jgi:hypothetical protein
MCCASSTLGFADDGLFAQAVSTTVVCALCAHSIRGSFVLATCGITPRSSFLLVTRLFPFSLELSVPETGHNSRCQLTRKIAKTPKIRDSHALARRDDQALLP